MTVENIYEHIDEINGGIKEKLLAEKEMALKSKELVTWMEVPGRTDIDPARIENNIDFSHRKDILISKYQFNSLEKRIDELKNTYQKPVQGGLFG